MYKWGPGWAGGLRKTLPRITCSGQICRSWAGRLRMPRHFFALYSVHVLGTVLEYFEVDHILLCTSRLFNIEDQPNKVPQVRNRCLRPKSKLSAGQGPTDSDGQAPATLPQTPSTTLHSTERHKDVLPPSQVLRPPGAKPNARVAAVTYG
jgi:hypothetical protein